VRAAGAMLYYSHMAAEKSHRRPVTLDSLAALISRTAASADNKFVALAEDIADIKSSMTTKDDMADLKAGMMDRFEHVDEQLRH
jgi:hypothetical protein